MDEAEVYRSLGELNLSTNGLSKEVYMNCIKEFNPIYTGIVSLLSRELKRLNKLEEHINPIDDTAHIKSFVFEVSSFLKELGCPYCSLIDGPLEMRLTSYEDRIKLMKYLISELQASKMIAANTTNESSKRLALSESPIAQHIRLMLQALSFPKPPLNITTTFLFSKVIQKVKDTIAAIGPEYLGNPLFTGQLTQKQWQDLAHLAEEMGQEYKMRKELLLTRLDVTVESFTWSQRLKDKKGLISEKYEPKRRCLDTKTDINVADLLSARDDLLNYDKTSDTNVRKNTQSQINKVLIGKVPDRGGRPSETEPPPPEVPSWQKNAPSTNSHQGSRDFKSQSGRGRGNFDGGKVQGGWSSNDRRFDDRNFQNSHYQHSAGNHHQVHNQGTWYGPTGIQQGANNPQFMYDTSSTGNHYMGRGRGNPVGMPGGNAYGARHSDFGTYSEGNPGDPNTHENYGSRGGGRGRGHHQNPYGRGGGYHH